MRVAQRQRAVDDGEVCFSAHNRISRSSSSRVPIVEPITDSCKKNTRESSAGGESPVVAPETTSVPPGFSARTECAQVASPTVSITRSTRSGSRTPASNA